MILLQLVSFNKRHVESFLALCDGGELLDDLDLYWNSLQGPSL